MTIAGSETLAPDGAAYRRSQIVAARALAPLRILAVVDGTERTNRVIDYLVAIAHGREATEIAILNVQSKGQEARLRGYESFKKEEIDDRLINDLGVPIVNSVGRVLDKVGIRNFKKVMIGEPVETALRCAAEDRCDAVVVGGAEPGRLHRWIMETTGVAFGASTAARLATLAPIPVVVVK